MSNTPNDPERDAPNPILPEPVGEDGFVLPEDDAEAAAPAPQREKTDTAPAER